MSPRGAARSLALLLFAASGCQSPQPNCRSQGKTSCDETCVDLQSNVGSLSIRLRNAIR